MFVDIENLIPAIQRRALDEAYTMALQYPRIGIPLIRAHCDLRRGYTNADPFKTIWIEPSQITGISEYYPRRAYGVVASGSWDQNCRPISELPAVDALNQYYKHSDQERLREVFESHVEKRNGRAWGHTSADSFEERLNEIDELYRSINTNGYRSQQEVLKSGHDLSNNEPVPWCLNEVTVDIGRDGQFLYCGFGSHRLAISKLLGVNEICVKVGARHAGWENTKRSVENEMERTDAPSSILKHPDIEDL